MSLGWAACLPPSSKTQGLLAGVNLVLMQSSLLLLCKSSCPLMHLPSASWEGRGGHTGLTWGNRGTLWGLCNKFLPLWWVNCGDFAFWMPYSWEECGDFASVQLRGDKERSLVRSIDGKKVDEKKKVSFRIHCFLSIKQAIKKTVKNLHVFVGISNFKIPLCIYYCL